MPNLIKSVKEDTMNVIQDIGAYKIFSVGIKYGIKTWCNRLILNPICTRRPNLEELERFGYTFIVTEEGCNLVDNTGNLYLEEQHISKIGWFIQNKVVAYATQDGHEGLFFVKTKLYIRNITNANDEHEFIQTFCGKYTGAAAHSGKQIFEPNYSAVAIFDKEIYIAYKEDGTAILNSLAWKNQSEEAENFKLSPSGIMAQYKNGTYAWIKPETGEKIDNSELTRCQQQLIKLAEKKDSLTRKKE